MRKEILRVTHLYKSINGSSVLNGLNLSVYEGEILGLTGLSGTGKSMIAEILTGRRSYDSGEICLCGRRMGTALLRDRGERIIYSVTENPCLFSCLTIEENICLLKRDPLGDFHFMTKLQSLTVQEALRSLDICLDPKSSVRGLSLYEKHVIAIARAYYMQARLIIIDNISNNYTEEEFRRLGRLLLKIRSKGIGILFMESALERVVSFTDRLIVLRNGRDEGTFFRDEYAKYQITKVMLGDYGVPVTPARAVSSREKQILLSVSHVSNSELKDLSFTLKKGEVIGFIDEEKIFCQDVLRLFLGNAEMTEGTVLLEGVPVNLKAGREVMIHSGFGYVDYYKKSIFPKLSLRDNLTISSLDRLTSRTMIHTRLENMVVCDLLKHLGVPTENMKKPLKDVSNREQLIVALYKWILNRSRVVILNNVFSGTDMIMRNIVVRFLNELRMKEFGAILFSPNAREIYELCDCVYTIRGGRLFRNDGFVGESEKTNDQIAPNTEKEVICMCINTQKRNEAFLHAKPVDCDGCME